MVHGVSDYGIRQGIRHRRMVAGAIVASAQDWAKAQTVGNPQLRNVAQLDTAKDRSDISGASHRTQQRADKVAKAQPASTAEMRDVAEKQHGVAGSVTAKE